MRREASLSKQTGELFSAVFSIKSPSSNRRVPRKAPMGRNLPVFLLFLRYNNVHKMEQESFVP